MAKGSVRKKGKKWYYRFYVEDASGKIKAGRLPHPDMEIRGRVEQRVGYTIEQINHMRDVFGTRLRRAEPMMRVRF